MMRKWILIVLCSATFGIASEQPTIVKITSIAELPTTHPSNTIIFFDLDDTLIDCPYMLGSKAWRKYIFQATNQNWRDTFSLFLANNLTVTAIESMTAQVVRELQGKGYGVCGFTARNRNMWFDIFIEGIDVLTMHHLKSADIHFDSDAFEDMYPGLAQDSEYFRGVFFTGTDFKGDYLKQIFATAVERPEKIIFVDDKLKQIQSVDSALKELAIDHICYWYCATADKAKTFNPLIANIQLFYVLDSNTILSDQEAAIIAQQHPEYNADHYLQLILIGGECRDVNQAVE